MKAVKDFYKSRWNFEERNKNTDAYTYRHTTNEMIEFAEAYAKQSNRVSVEQLKEWEQFKKNHWRESDAVDVKAVLMERFAEMKKRQPLPEPPKQEKQICYGDGETECDCSGLCKEKQ